MNWLCPSDAPHKNAPCLPHNIIHVFSSYRLSCVCPQIASEGQTLEASAAQYNGCARRLKLVPLDAKRSEGITYQLNVKTDGGAAPSELANIDLKVGVIQGASVCEYISAHPKI